MRQVSVIVGILLVVGRCAGEWPVVNCPDTFRSPVIRSGDNQAYSVTEARPDPRWECANTSRLYVSVSGRPFQVVYTRISLDITDNAGSILPIAWSPDGRWLAIEAFYSTHLPTDFASYGLLLFDSRARKVKEPEIDFDAAVSKALNRECDVWLNSVIGFDGSGDIILNFNDFYDAEGVVHACVGDDSKWLFSPGDGQLRPQAR